MCQAKDTPETVSVVDSSEGEEYEEENEEEDENTICIRAKWMFENCKTIDEIIERLKAEITHYEKMKSEGYELIDEVMDDYGFLKKKD